MQYDTKIAVVIRTDLEVWQKLNVAAFLAGGLGAGLHSDGAATTIFPSSASNVPVELFENAVPLLVTEKELLRFLEETK